jgi:hypothetical protein
MEDGGIDDVLRWTAVYTEYCVDLGECCDSMFDRLCHSRGRKEGSAAGAGPMPLARADQVTFCPLSTTRRLLRSSVTSRMYSRYACPGLTRRVVDERKMTRGKKGS